MKPNLHCGACVALATVILTLAGCGKDQTTDPKAQAGGEVLPGSVSDAMLPLDTVRSQPPLAPRSDASGKAAMAGDEQTAAESANTAAGDGAPGEAAADAGPSEQPDAPTPDAE